MKIKKVKKLTKKLLKKNKVGRPAKKLDKEDSKVKRAPRTGTAREFVIGMLRKGKHTRDDIAKAIMKNGLTSKKKIANVKNYVSVMLHGLKSTHKGFEVVERGIYTINKK